MCECGAVLVAEATRNGIVTVDGEFVKFSRRTDYIACASCLRSYPARDVLLPPEGDEDDPEPVEKLERMLEPDEDVSPPKES